MWRVTKYNPVNRDENGYYLKDEWTSFSDIGKLYNGIEFTIEEYLKYEKAYIDSILVIMDCNNIDNLNIINLEKYEEDNEYLNTFTEGMLLSNSQIKEVVRLVLRDEMWCKLIKDDSFFVHFGYDFYMYIGANNKCDELITFIEDKDIFIETFVSPYLD